MGGVTEDSQPQLCPPDVPVSYMVAGLDVLILSVATVGRAATSASPGKQSTQKIHLVDLKPALNSCLIPNETSAELFAA